MSRQLIFCLMFTGLAAACTGSGGDGGESYAEYSRAARDMHDRVAVMDRTGDAAMPRAGTASYQGYVGAWTSDGDQPNVLGDLRMTANFQDDTLTGQIDNWRSDDGAAMPGTVRLRDGYISDTSLGADLEGRLRIEGVDADVDGHMWGEFHGSDAQAARGELSAIVAGQDYVDGTWVVERMR